jgi:hypothetical protein
MSTAKTLLQELNRGRVSINFSYGWLFVNGKKEVERAQWCDIVWVYSSRPTH